jgi:hypothetical protein
LGVRIWIIERRANFVLTNISVGCWGQFASGDGGGNRLGNDC